MDVGHTWILIMAGFLGNHQLVVKADVGYEGDTLFISHEACDKRIQERVEMGNKAGQVRGKDYVLRCVRTD